MTATLTATSTAVDTLSEAIAILMNQSLASTHARWTGILHVDGSVSLVADGETESLATVRTSEDAALIMTLRSTVEPQLGILQSVLSGLLGESLDPNGAIAASAVELARQIVDPE